MGKKACEPAIAANWRKGGCDGEKWEREVGVNYSAGSTVYSDMDVLSVVTKWDDGDN